MIKLHRYNQLSSALCIIMDSTQASLWGIEANYPGADSYLTEVATELLPEAIAAGRETLARLVSHADALEDG